MYYVIRNQVRENLSLSTQQKKGDMRKGKANNKVMTQRVHSNIKKKCKTYLIFFSFQFLFFQAERDSSIRRRPRNATQRVELEENYLY